MGRLATTVTVVLALTLGGILPATATTEGAATGPAAPAGALENVEFLGNLPEAVGATAINFLQYEQLGLDVMFVVGRFGLRAYDITDDPAAPRFLDSIDNKALSLPADVSGTYWQNEDMDVDPRRKLVFLARDPRAFDGTTATGTSGVYLIQARDPSDLRLITFHELPAGNTSTCINGCRFLWTGGPAEATTQPADWGGRPTFVTDIRDPRRPHTYPDPVDTARNEGRTDYAHEVQVDVNGVLYRFMFMEKPVKEDLEVGLYTFERLVDAVRRR